MLEPFCLSGTGSEHFPFGSHAVFSVDAQQNWKGATEKSARDVVELILFVAVNLVSGFRGGGGGVKF